MTEPRVLYLCPDDDTPSGGIRVIYRHVDALNANGIAAAVLHAQQGFRCTWFAHDTRVVHDVTREDAVVAIPEIYGPQLAQLFPGKRKVVFNQGAYNTFAAYSLDPTDRETPYTHPEVAGAIVVSDDSAEYLAHAFPHLKVLRTFNSVDTELFTPSLTRRRRIAFMPRRNLETARQVLSILKFRGALDDVELLPLEGLPEREVAAALHDALVFLSLGTAEGCPTPPKEAMASGCLVVGYHGNGGREFMRPDVAYPVETGDVLGFARTLEGVLEAHQGDPVQLPARGRAAAELIRDRYSAARETESVVGAWRELLGSEPESLHLARARVDEQPLASIAILTLNGLEHTRACLESIEAHTPEPHELVLVDNGSTDDTVTFLREYATAHKHVRLVLNSSNRGFAAGSNQALSLARGRYVVLLNNDMVVGPGWLAGLVAAIAEKPDRGLAGPMSNWAGGAQRYHADVPYSSTAEIAPFVSAWRDLHAGEREEVERLVGFCLAARRDVIDAIGGLDDAFGPGNCEDNDFCLRARSAGFRAVIARDVYVHHAGGRSFAAAEIDYAEAMDCNSKLFAEKWGTTWEDVAERGPSAVEPALLERNRYIPLPDLAATHDLQLGGRIRVQSAGGEPRVAANLEAAAEAVRMGDLRGLAAAFAAPLVWDEPQRAYQALRHLAELVLAAGEHATESFWPELYTTAAAGVLASLEREPAEPVLLNSAGIFLYELTELDAAAALFEAAAGLDPDLEQARENLAAIEERRANGAHRLARPELHSLAERAHEVATRAQPAEGLTLSLCMIVKDEEEMLPGCLEAARGAVDEIVVVDTGSSDRTVEIAESFGAKVVRHEWNGDFSAARNVSLEHATGDWILYLDADEHLVDGSADELRAQLGKTWREAFYLAETNYTGGEDFGTAVAHLAMRVFRNRPEYRFEGRIHEQKTGSMPTYLPERFETTTVRVLHYGYLNNRINAREKSRRNLELLERQAAESPNPFTSFNLGSEYLVLGEWERAAAQLDEAWAAIGNEPGWCDIGYAPMLVSRTATARRLCGRIADARALLLSAIREMPDHTDLHFELALCARIESRNDEAHRLLTHCIELGDAPPRYSATVGCGSYLALCLLGGIAEERGDDAEAEELYRRSLAGHPEYPVPVLQLATLLLRRGVAAADLEQELPLDRPRHALLAATACLEQKEVEVAEQLFRRVLAHQPHNTAAAVGLLESLLSQRRYSEAADEATAHDLGTSRLFACAAGGDPAGLEQALLEADVSAAERELYFAWAAALGGADAPSIGEAAFDAALVALEALLRVEEFDSFDTLHSVAAAAAVPETTRRQRLAELYLRRGYLDSAEDEWQASLPAPEALVGLAQVAVARGDRELAAELAREALERAPGLVAAQRLAAGLRAAA